MKTKINIIYNVVYQLLITIIPFVTAHHIANIFGVEGVGIYSYAYAVSNYFGYFILLGLNNYGNRIIASIKSNKEKRSKTFCEIYFFQLIMLFIVGTIYLIYAIFFAVNKEIAIILFIYILSVGLDINWFYFGMELFKLTVIRNIIIKITSIIFIIVFVKQPDDLNLYAIIMTVAMLLSQVVLWITLPKYIKFYKCTMRDIFKHIKPNLILFIPVIAVSLYKIMDKVMLGILSSTNNVGLYENAEKITITASCLITAIGTVMLPRISNMISIGNKKEAKLMFEKSLKLVMIICIAMFFGIISVSNETILLLYGAKFKKSVILLKLLSSTVIALGWNNVIRTQYLIPYKRDKEYIISVFSGAIVNILFNIVLIPKYEAVGAVIGTIFAEFTVCIIQTYYIRNELNILKLIKYFIPYMFIGLLMQMILQIINILKVSILVSLILKIFIGICIYSSLTFLYVWKFDKKLIKGIIISK